MLIFNYSNHEKQDPSSRRFQYYQRNVKKYTFSKSFEIKTASNGKEAFEILSKSPDGYDLVLSDYNMPEMDGYELLKSVRQSSELKNKPFILLTTENDPEKMKSAKKAGLTAWVKKPYKLDAFLSQISYAIQKD